MLQHRSTSAHGKWARSLIKPKPVRPALGLVLPTCLLHRRDNDRTLSPIILGQSRVALLPLDPGQRCVATPEAGRGLTVCAIQRTVEAASLPLVGNRMLRARSLPLHLHA